MPTVRVTVANDQRAAGRKAGHDWLWRVLERKPVKVVAVAHVARTIGAIIAGR